MSSLLDLIDLFPGIMLKVLNTVFITDILIVKKMVNYSSHFLFGYLGAADVQLSVYLYAVAIDDLAVKKLCEPDSHVTFSYSCRTDNGYYLIGHA